MDKSVLLWTRAVPTSPTGALPDQSVPVCVSFKIGTKSDLSGPIVDSGEAFTSYDVDFTVKVEATNLKPDTKYFYQFSDCTNPKTTSPIGATRTISDANSELFFRPSFKINPLSDQGFSTSQIRQRWKTPSFCRVLVFAISSWYADFVPRSPFSNLKWATGWFNAYGFAALNTTADIFIHLGDYVRSLFFKSVIIIFIQPLFSDRSMNPWAAGKPIRFPNFSPVFGIHTTYTSAKIGRQTLGRELATIHDYRQRLNQYRTDQSLVIAHQNAPWITVW